MSNNGLAKNRPRNKAEGYITIIKELDWKIRYVLEKDDQHNFAWFDSSNILQSSPVEIVWKDIYVSSIDWGKKPKTVTYPPIGLSGERTEIIGFEPSLSFKCAYINKDIYRLMKFRTKYRILLEYQADNSNLLYDDDAFEFKGCVYDDWKAGGDLVEETINLKVEELPDEPI